MSGDPVTICVPCDAAALSVGADALADALERGHLIEQQVIAILRRLADRALAAGADPHRRMGLLHGRRLDDDLVELPALGLVGPAVGLGEGPFDDGDRFLEDILGIGHVDAEAGKLVGAVAAADAEIVAALGDLIEGADLLSEHDRVEPRHHDDGATKTNFRRYTSEIAKIVQGC